MIRLPAFMSRNVRVLVCTLCLAVTAPLSAQPPGTASTPPGSGFVPPTPMKKVDAVYPLGGAAQLQESTVELTMTIDVKGKAHDIKVTHSTGSKAFDYAAVQALERWTFAPATQDGQPVEAPYQLRYAFLVNTRDMEQNSGGARLTNVQRGSSRDFSTAYSALQKAVQVRDRATADAALARLQITNQYEEASYGLAAYQYAAVWGDPAQQIEALRRAVSPDNAAQDFSYGVRNPDEFEHYLPVEIWKTALLTLLQLDIKARSYAEALQIWGRLQKAGIKPELAAKLAPVMEQIKAQGGGNPP
jgi:TonB family protein